MKQQERQENAPRPNGAARERVGDGLSRYVYRPEAVAASAAAARQRGWLLEHAPAVLFASADRAA